MRMAETVSRPEMLGFRVTLTDRGLVEAVAKGEGLCTAELLRRIVLPQVRKRLAEQLQATGAKEGEREMVARAPWLAGR